MRAGLSIGDLSPEPGVELGGYPYFERANEGVHDPLWGAALYLQDAAGHDVIVIATDLFWLTRRQGEAMRQRASEASGVPAERIIITCSHTHSAPWMSVVFEAFPGQPAFETIISDDYVDAVTATCARLAGEAVAGAFDAKLAYGIVQRGPESGVGGNRRDPENGPRDSDVPALVIRDASGAVRGVWTKYAVHPTILHGENKLVSADFPGAIRATVAERHPDAVFLYSMGAAGDQSPRYFRSGQTFDEVERFGRTLGEGVLKAIDLAVPLDEPTLQVLAHTTDLPVKTYPDPDTLLAKVEKLRAREAELIAAGASYVDRQNANLWLLGAECEYANAAKERDGRLQARYDACAPFEVTTLAIDGIAWVFLPGEVFMDFALDIKRRSPYTHTNVITLTNGDLPGYCVTRVALEIGGYEPGNSILDPAAGDVLVDLALRGLTTLKNS